MHYIRWRQSPSRDSTTLRSSALAAGKGTYLVQSLPTVVQGNPRPGTYIINLQKRAQDTSFLTFLLYWLTVSRVRAANFVRRPCSNSSHITAPYKLSFYYYYYYYYYYSREFDTVKNCRIFYAGQDQAQRNTSVSRHKHGMCLLQFHYSAVFYVKLFFLFKWNSLELSDCSWNIKQWHKGFFLFKMDSNVIFLYLVILISFFRLQHTYHSRDIACFFW